MYYISNKRDFFPLSNDVFNFESEYERRKMYMKKCFYCFYFLIVHFSINNVLSGLDAYRQHSRRGNCVSNFCFKYYFLF